MADQIPNPSREEHELLMVSPEARDQRRQAKLGMLPVRFAGQIRGTMRASRFEYSPVPVPPNIPADAIDAIRREITTKPILRNRFIQGYSPSARKSDIEEYAMGGNKRNKRVGNTPEEQVDIDLKKQRQTQHIADRLQLTSRHRMHTADLRKTALRHVAIATRLHRAFDLDAAVWASDAIEDLGISMRDSDLRAEVLEVSDLPTDIEHVGAYSFEHPEFLRDNLALVELATLVNESRYRYWGKLFHVSMQTDRDRRTNQDKADDTVIAQTISSFRSISPETFVNG